MESALDEIEFLALSANRVEALSLLAEGSRTRGELADATGASQPTLGRILEDFEERQWVRRTEDGRHVATATGELVADGFGDLIDVFETEAKLREVVEWLPTDALGCDLRRLSTATITVPSRTRPDAPVQRLLDLLREADEARIVSHAFNEASLRVVEERVRAGDDPLEFRGVFSPSAIDAIAGDSGLRDHLRALIDADDAAVRISESEVPLAVTVADDVVHLLLRDERGILQAAVETADRTVREWALSTHERHWKTATPLSADELGGS
jgi:predicted transcriptional regulator